MGKYSKKLLNHVQEHNLKKKLDETDNFEEIQQEAIKQGLGDFVHNESPIEKGCFSPKKSDTLERKESQD